MQIFSPNTVGCTKCGLASPRLIPMDYHQFTKSYQEPTKQTFDQEKHFIQWVYNLLGTNSPKKDILPLLREIYFYRIRFRANLNGEPTLKY